MSVDDLADFISSILSTIAFLMLCYYAYKIEKKVKKMDEEMIKLKKRLRQYE